MRTVAICMVLFGMPFSGSILALCMISSAFLPTTLLSGFTTPAENMPQWLQHLAVINPLKHFLVIVKGIFLKDMPFSDVLENIYPMILISATTLPFATWMFRKRLG